MLRTNAVNKGRNDSINSYSYYEDLYGRINSDEELDQNVDLCESDEDTDKEHSSAPKKITGRTTDFFKQFSTPVRGTGSRKAGIGKFDESCE